MAEVKRPTQESMGMRRLSDEICDIIFSAPFINRAELQPRIYALIKATTQQINTPKIISAKFTKPSKIDRYIKTIFRRDLEIKMWREELKKYCNDDQMKDFYQRQNSLLKENNVLKIE